MCWQEKESYRDQLRRGSLDSGKVRGRVVQMGYSLPNAGDAAIQRNATFVAEETVQKVACLLSGVVRESAEGSDLDRFLTVRLPAYLSACLRFCWRRFVFRFGDRGSGVRGCVRKSIREMGDGVGVEFGDERRRVRELARYDGAFRSISARYGVTISTHHSIATLASEFAGDGRVREGAVRLFGARESVLARGPHAHAHSHSHAHAHSHRVTHHGAAGRGNRVGIGTQRSALAHISKFARWMDEIAVVALGTVREVDTLFGGVEEGALVTLRAVGIVDATLLILRPAMTLLVRLSISSFLIASLMVSSRM